MFCTSLRERGSKISLTRVLFNWEWISLTTISSRFGFALTEVRDATARATEPAKNLRLEIISSSLFSQRQIPKA
jgi:hypothetical protein